MNVTSTGNNHDRKTKNRPTHAKPINNKIQRFPDVSAVGGELEMPPVDRYRTHRGFDHAIMIGRPQSSLQNPRMSSVLIF